jgi:hypothetical protein
MEGEPQKGRKDLEKGRVKDACEAAKEKQIMAQ